MTKWSSAAVKQHVESNAAKQASVDMPTWSFVLAPLPFEAAVIARQVFLVDIRVG
ncbi:hypothetical protein [Bradyrhizobium liaoningense]|uniref:hypothetical protein n=1 Tax=Bradyrhizobium liaoningense TaxID=43992 RepID=UPI001BA65E11|nr:hypothetical protein [Bradyrhizobium liaoningense]MBR0856964.1 hypothetical protein [Bradyrhizobium liaoningense]